MTNPENLQAALRADVPDDGARRLHLWWCSDDESVFDRNDWSSASERAREASYRFEHLRRSHRVRSSFLRAVLAAYVDASPEALRFRSGERGKPYLEGDDPLHFNLSYSEGRVLVAVTRVCEVGVDLQGHIALEDDLGPMARQVMTREEHEAFLASPGGEHVRRFYRLWARKEAVLKASGQGLFREPNSFDVGHAVEPEARALAAPDPNAWDGVRSLGDLSAPDGYSAAVASVSPELPPVRVARPAT